MSAWVVSPRHIDYLVEAIRHLKVDEIAQPGLSANMMKATNTDIGRMLMWENVRSVSERYPYDTFESLPGPVDKKRVIPYRYRRSKLPFNPLAVLKAAACYEYQSCEHDYWDASLAKAVVEDLKEAAIATLPTEAQGNAYTELRSYDAMPWGIDEGSSFGPMVAADPKVDAIVEGEAIVRGLV